MDAVCHRCTYLVRTSPNDDNRDRTLIHAARNGHQHCVNKLLAAGASVNFKSNKGYTALWHAVHMEQFICMDQLIGAGADVNAVYDFGETLLMWSAEKGYDKIVTKLIEAGSDLNIAASDVLGSKITPLMCAANGGHSNCALILLKAGANVNIKNRSEATALMYAAAQDYGCLKILTERGAHVNCRDSAGETALDYAVKNKRLCNIEHLLKCGANVNNVDEYGKSVLMKALTTDSNPDCVRLLIKNKIDINSTDNDGKSALVYATVNSCEQSMKILIEEGADVNMAVNQGHEAGLTPLIASSLAGNISGVRMLLSAGAYVNKGSNAINCHLSRSQRNEDLLKLLLVAGETTTDRQIMKLVFHGPAEETKDEEELHFEDEQDINLMYKCRDTIRGHIATTNPHVNMFSAVVQLGLPDLMCSYLLYNLTLTEKE